jgi:hypothetical protein
MMLPVIPRSEATRDLLFASVLAVGFQLIRPLNEFEHGQGRTRPDTTGRKDGNALVEAVDACLTQTPAW